MTADFFDSQPSFNPSFQTHLEPSAPPPRFFTKRIQRRTSFSNMLKGYRTSLKVVSCWHSLETVLEYFEKGLEDIELVVGDSITDHYRTDLSGSV